MSIKDSVSVTELPVIQRPRCIISGYALALLLTIATFFLRQKLSISFGERPLLILFMFPVLVSALTGGIGPGLLATFLAAACTGYFLIPPVYSFSIAATHDALQWMMLITNGALVSVMSEFLHRSRQREIDRWQLLVQARSELQQSNARFEATFEQAGVGIAMVAPDGRWLRVNRKLCDITGYSQEELLSRTFCEIAHPGDLDAATDYWHNMIEMGNDVVSKELRSFRKNGSIVWLNITVAFIRKPDGTPDYFISVIDDMTDRKLSEEALWDSERRLVESNELLSGVLDHTYMMAVFLDRQFNFIWVNRAYAETCKHERSFFQGKNHFELYPHEENQRIFQRVVDTGEPFFIEAKSFEFPDQPERGVTWWDWSLIPLKDDTGKVTGLVFTLAEVTTRKRAEVALRESEEKYRTVADFTFDWEYWIAPDGSLPYVSPSCERITGYRAEEYQKDPGLLTRIVHPEDRDQVTTHLCAGRQTPDINYSSLSFRLITRNNEERWISHECQPVFNHEGQYQGRRASNRDISKRKRAEAAKEVLESQNRQLQKAESLSRMAGAIAHHFNNQLYVVTGNLEMVMDNLPHGACLLESLTQAMKAARRAAEVSSLMLTYLGQTTAKQEPMDICEVCDRNLPLLQASLPGTIRLNTDFPSPGPTINGNPHQVQQVLTNMIANAGEACDGRGDIYLGVTMVSAEDIPRSYRFPIDWEPQDTAYACLEVGDSGCGIMEKDIEKIFDPFFTTKFPGRGLGLSVVLGIIKAHNGVITVESKLGTGSVFRAFLPVSTEVVVYPPQKAVKAPEMLEGVTVLLVEDEEEIRKTAKMMLRRLGFKVLETRDGVEAVEVFRQHKDEINCVLCDLTMPRMNGLETLTALRTLSPDLSVILYSGHDEGQAMEGDHPDRPDAFLHKPFSMEELTDVIQQILAKK
jgi:two-component system, cell cycle sensor histidine kinase and response regulator CckA